MKLANTNEFYIYLTKTHKSSVESWAPNSHGTLDVTFKIHIVSFITIYLKCYLLNNLLRLNHDFIA